MMEGEMNKSILVIYYSQTGQLKRILDSITSNIMGEVNIDFLEIKMDPPYPFPWSPVEFFDTFPETVNQTPQKIAKVEMPALEKYDLIILGYQTWYMSPSIPVNSFLAGPEAKKLFNDTPVVTVIGCRNMWMIGQEKMKKNLIDLNAKLVGNIALVDKTPNLIGIITVIGWMMKGIKKKLFGFLPESGVSSKDIQDADRFGPIIETHLNNNDLSELQATLVKAEAVVVYPNLLFLEKRANRLFGLWSKFMLAKGGPGSEGRKSRAKVLLYLIPLGATILAPVTIILSLITRILNQRKFKEIKRQYASNELASI